MRPFTGKAHSRALGVITLFLCFLLCLSLVAHRSAWAQDAESSTQDLESLVQTIEDPEKRKALLDQLRGLIKAQKAVESGEGSSTRPRESAETRLALLSESLFSQFDGLLEKIVSSARETGILIKRIPQGLAQARRHLSRPDARQALLRLLGVAFGALLTALFFRLILRRRLPRPRAPEAAWPSRLAASSGTWVLKVLPSGMALLALFLFFQAVPHQGVGRAVVFHLFTVLFGYRIVVEGVRSLLSPEEPGLRIFGVGDESAYYYWVWLRRFANYAALYFLLVGPLSLFKVPESAYLFIRGLLLLVFPGMITALVLQISRDLRAREEAPGSEPQEKTGPGDRWRRLSTRVLPILAILYAWAFFLVIMGSREEGFSFLFQATLGTAVTIPAVIAALHLLDWLFDKLFAVHERIKARMPGIEERADRYLALVRKVSAVVLVLIGAGVVAEFWGVPVSDFVVSSVGSVILSRAVAIAVTLAVMVTILQLNRIVSVYLLREKAGRTVTQKTKTLVPMVRAAAGIATLFVGGIVILSQIGVDTTPILAGAGIVGLAVGFGSQTLVKDLINGLFILFEESIRVGDWAQLGNKDGEVEAVGLRTVRLRDLGGNVHVIPNSSVDTLTNFSKEYARSLLDIGVAYRENVDEVIALMQEVAEGMQKDAEFGRDILGPITILGLDRFDDSAVVIRAFFTTRPLTQWRIRREFHLRIKRAFDERGIEIPFPHRTVYMGESKQGKAPPVYVEVDKPVRAAEEQDSPPSLPSSTRFDPTDDE